MRQLIVGLALLITVFSQSLHADVPTLTTFQARIIAPSGAPLEAASVSFRFTVLDGVGTCILYVEDYANVSMAGSQGLAIFGLGSGAKSYPSGGVKMVDVFNNSTNSFPCQAGGTYMPGPTDRRQLVMQFNDGTAGWQTVPQMAINSVLYANYATRAEKLGNYPADDYLRPVNLPTCSGSQALNFDGTRFICIEAGAAGGGVASVSGTLPVVVGGSTSTPVISMAKASAAASGYLSSGDWTTFNNKASATLSSGQLYLGNGSNSATGVSLSGDATLANTGVMTLANTGVSAATYGSAATVPFLTVDSKGRVTSATSAAYQDASPSAKGIVQIGSNLTITGGLLSMQSSDITQALGYTPANSTAGFLNAGNSFGAAASLGTNDNYNLSFKTNNSTQMTIDTSGNVGIGTTTQGSKLEVSGNIAVSNGATRYLQMKSVSGIDADLFNIVGGNVTSGTGNAGSLNLGGGSSSSIGNGGSVNIFGGSNGSTSGSPGSVFISGGNNNSVSVAQPGGSVSISGGVSATNTAGNPGGSVAISGGSAFLGNNNGGSISINGGLGSGAGFYGAILLNSVGGYVGIGTASPARLLHVNGPMRMTPAALPGTPATGDMVIDSGDGNKFKYYDGSAWQTGSGGGGGASLTGVTSIANSGGDITLSPVTTTGAVLINSGTPSVGVSSGAMVVTGGVGVSGSLYTGGSINAGSTLSAVTSVFTPQIYGSSAASGNLLIDGTSHATKGNVLLASAGGNVGVGTATPTAYFDIVGPDDATGTTVPVLQAIGGTSSTGVGAGINLRAGISNAGVDGGSVTISSGYTTNVPISNRSSTLNLTGSTWGAYPGTATLSGGHGYAGQNGGSVTLVGGNPHGDAAAGASILAEGGYFGSNGGNVVLNGGAKAWGPADGNVILANLQGKVGIGTTTPSQKLTVVGTIVSVPNVITGATVDLSISNTVTLNTVGGSSIALTNMVHGGDYTIVVQDQTVRTYTFTGCASTKFKPANAATTASSDTIYSIMTVRNGSSTYDCYITWASGYQ